MRALAPLPKAAEQSTSASAMRHGRPFVSHNTYEAVPSLQRQTSASSIGAGLGSLIERSQPSGRLPDHTISRLGGIPGHTLEKIRIYDDPAAHRAAQALEAHAFTIGSSLYFAQGAYQPSTRIGLRVLAHEAAHAHQQANAALPPTAQLRVTAPDSTVEVEAAQVANALAQGATIVPPRQLPAGTIARVMRLPTFAAQPDPPAPLDITLRVNPEPVGGKTFVFGGGGGQAMTIGNTTYPAEPYIFSWKSTVQIHGAPDEKFSSWEVGMLQTMRKYKFDIWWGEQNPKHCGCDYIRLHDGKDTSVPWFDKDQQSRPFNGDGDTVSATIDDSPWAQIPYQNQKLGSEQFGRFDYYAAFTTYVSAHNREAGDSLEAFRPLKSVRWQVALKGNFDSRPTPRTLEVQGGTKVDSIIDASREESPVIGGDLALDKIAELPACWTP